MAPEIQTVNVKESLNSFDDHWSPRIIAELNGQQVKVAKLLGEFDWHHHEAEDELFWVIRGELEILFRDRTEVLREGDMLVIPKGVEHKPVAVSEVEIVLFEPATTLNTGNIRNEKTVDTPKRIS